MKLVLTLIIVISFYLIAQNDPYELNQYMLAENYEQSGNPNKAIEIVEELFQKNPNNPTYFNKLYNLYLLTKKYETAIRIVELKISQNPIDPTYYGMLGSIYYLMGDIKKAKANWEIPIKNNPENPFTYRMMANYAIERRAFETAIEFLINGKSKSNDPSIFAMDLGELYLITMQYEAAMKEYCEMLLNNQAMYPVVESKIFSFINKPDVIQNAIKIVEKYKNKGIVFKNLLAKLLTESRQFIEAFELYKEIEKEQSTGGQQLLNYANFLINENVFDVAKQVFEYTFNHATNNYIKSSAKLGLAKTLDAILWNNFNKENDVWKSYYQPKYFSELKTDNVIKAYEEVINLFKYSDVAVEAIYSIAKIKFYINNDLNDAEKYFNEIITNYPTSRFYSKSLLELSLIKIMLNNFQQAKELLRKIESVPSYSEEEKLSSYFYLARLNALEGNFISASDYIRKITSNVKNDFTNDALEFSILLNVAKNDSINLIKYTKAEILIIQKKYKDAQILFDEIAKNQQSLIFQPFCQLKSAELDIALNDYTSAEIILDQIYSLKEKNIFSDKALYLKAKIYQYALDNLSKAIELYQKILIEFPKSIYVDESRESIIRLNDEIIKRKKDA
jgi:tetratricopeptide (TPR) repeat protein